jgi:hypothetical protein
MESSSIEIKLNRTDRVYNPGEIVEGVCYLNCFKGWSHNGLCLVADGIVHMHSPEAGATLSLEGSEKMVLFQYDTELIPKGSLPHGTVELPFRFELTSRNNLVESYHGVYVSVIYNIGITCDRGMMKKTLKKDMEFILEIPSGSVPEPTPKEFHISPASLENIDARILRKIPDFLITGKMHRLNCNINQPFTGEVTVEMSVATINSLELQLVRVESTNLRGAFVKEASEVQVIQIGEGNTCRGLTVPIYMVFPRLFSCPTVVDRNYKIEFEVNLRIIFGDGHCITENFPLKIVRD